MTPLRRKLLLVLFGFAGSLVCLEIGLRLAGLAFFALQDYRNKAALRREGTYRILCLGESTTAFGGDSSYPSQLQVVLGERCRDIRFSVINKGVPGTNTFGIVEELQENLDNYRPHMVIAMAGANDIFLSLTPYGPADLPKAAFSRSPLKIGKLTAFLLDAFSRGHSEKEEELFRRALEEDPDKGTAYVRRGLYYLKNRGKFLEAEEMLEKAIELDPQNAVAHWRLGTSYDNRQEWLKAEEMYKKALALDPRSSRALSSLGDLYLRRGDSAQGVEKLKEAIAFNPRSFKALTLLGMFYYGQGDFQQAEALLRQAVDAKPLYDRSHRALVTLYEELARQYASAEYQEKARQLKKEAAFAYHPAIRQNFLRIKSALDKRGVKLVCVQYPMRSVAPLKEVFAGEEGVLFVDNEGVFKDAVSQEGYGQYFIDMFAGDFGHCTTEGNRLLAENVAGVILKDYFHK